MPLSRRSFAALLTGGFALSACAPRAPLSHALMEEYSIADYRLGSGDRLRVIVFAQDNLSNIYAVNAQGRISMPLIGEVPAAGGTTKALAAAIEGRLRQGFLREPRVSVEVDAYRPFLRVGRSQQFRPISLCGGHDRADGCSDCRRIFAARLSCNSRGHPLVDGVPVTGTVPITAQLQPGDTVVIRERWF